MKRSRGEVYTVVLREPEKKVVRYPCKPLTVLEGRVVTVNQRPYAFLPDELFVFDRMWSTRSTFFLACLILIVD